MINMGITFIIIFSLGVAIVSVIQIIRISRLSDALEKIIDEIRDNRKLGVDPRSGDLSKLRYPDVNASYNNLKWYTPWKSTSSLIVYNKEI